MKGWTYLGVDRPAKSQDIQEPTDHKLSGESFHFYLCGTGCLKFAHREEKGKLFRVWLGQTEWSALS